MQTPGRRTQSSTPMFRLGRRMNSVGRNLSNISEETKIEKPQIRILGRIISQLDSMNNNLRDMSALIRRDVDSKQKYYREELKILKKDSQNLQNTNTRLFAQSRKGLATAAGALGVAQASTGNIGGAAQSFGASAALMSPEIIEFLTGSIVNSLALRGVLGNRGAGVNTASRVAGASKLKNPLLITAALAASFIIPSLVKANQTADRRRLESAQKTIRGAETIDRKDVGRFRTQLDRFDRILSSVRGDRKKQQKGVVDENFTEEKKENFPIINSIKKGISNFFKGNSLDKKVDKKVDNKDKSQIIEEKKEENNIVEEVNNNVSVIGDEVLNINNEDNSKFISQIDPKIDFTNEITENQIFNDNISNIFSPNNEFSVSVPNMSVKEMGDKIAKSNSNISILNLDSGSEGEKQSSSGFVGNAATPTNVHVTTKFKSSGGAIDKYDYAASLRAPVFS